MKKILKLYALILIAFCACDDPYEGSTYQVYDIHPISTYLSSNPENFSEWVDIMKYADLYNAINQASEFFTAFVPDNDAVQQYYQRKNISSIEELGKEYAAELVKYHIVHDTINEVAFTVEGKLSSKTLSDDYLSVSFGAGPGGWESVYLNDEARVKEFALPASNGYIYVMEDVLNPLLESVFERFEQNADEYTIFKEVLERTQWSDSLAIIYDDIRQSDGSYTQQKRNYTVLAVPDQSFRNSGINSVNDLIAALESNPYGESGTNYTDKNNKLFVYAAYHILNGNYSLLELQKFNSENKKKLVSTLSTNVIQITQEEDKEYYINLEGGEDMVAQFIEEACDLQAKNGVIHQLDAYLPMWETTTPVEVFWDFCDYPELASYIANNGVEGQQYQTVDPANEYRTDITSLTSVYSYYAPNPANNAYQAISYHTAKGTNAWANLLNGDQLTFNVGTNGWMEMESPAIIAGKYKVTLQFCYASTMAFIKNQAGGSNGGQMIFTFDGDTENYSITGKPYTTYPNADNVLGFHQWVMFDEIEFPTTKTHKFRITVTDPVASTNTDYRLQLDYLHFEPIIEGGEND